MLAPCGCTDAILASICILGGLVCDFCVLIWLQGEAGPDCVQMCLGWQPFILSIETQGPKQPPVVRGGSWYSSCRPLNTADKAGTLNRIIAAGQQSLAGTGIYRVDAKPRPLYMMWSPPGIDQLGYFTEYIEGDFQRGQGCF
jgi:hypothetical protein